MIGVRAFKSKWAFSGVALIALGLGVAAAFLTVSCAGRYQLGNYDFRDRNLAVAVELPLNAKVLTGPSVPGHSKDRIDAVVRRNRRIVKHAEGYALRIRLDTAAASFDVATRVAERA